MTLKDIADKAGVSMMTVSNVINGKHNRVSKKTIERINKIIKECGYVPNFNARSLTSKSSNIIQIIISSEDTYSDENFLENPYISSMVGTMEREFRKNGFYTMIRSISNDTDVNTLLKNWNIDGAIFLYHNNHLEYLSKSSPCPIAVFDSYTDFKDIINVSSDDEKGLYLSTKYLINHGHRKIAFVADYEGNPLLTNRFMGYKKALEDSNIEFNPDFIYKFFPSYEGGISAGKKIASDKNGVTGVVTTADICAIGVMEGARLEGYRIPLDLSVIGYDNLKLCQYTTPKLTTVSQDVTQKAIIACNLLIERIKTGTNSTPNHVITDVEIIERHSVVSIL